MAFKVYLMDFIVPKTNAVNKFKAAFYTNQLYMSFTNYNNFI